MKRKIEIPKFPRLEYNHSLARLVGQRTQAKVYQISKDKVAKVRHISPYLNPESFQSIQHEFNMFSQIYLCNISVPEPFGVYRVQGFNEQIAEDLAIVMELIKDPHVADLEGKERRLAEKALESELKKCRLLGFIPSQDSSPEFRNSFYCPIKKKITLIDFAFWNRRI